MTEPHGWGFGPATYAATVDGAGRVVSVSLREARDKRYNSVRTHDVLSDYVWDVVVADLDAGTVTRSQRRFELPWIADDVLEDTLLGV